jgi:hypothetical protein
LHPARAPVEAGIPTDQNWFLCRIMNECCISAPK